MGYSQFRKLLKPKWIILVFITFIFYGLLFKSADFTTARVAPDKTTTLRVISYNTQHLPLEVLNKYPHSQYRAKRQAELLCDYDIVGLNEVFVDRRRNEMCQILKDAWGADFNSVTSSKEDRSFFGLDSGLILLTRFPILESHTLTFGNDSRLRDRGFIADGYAKKGAIHARVKYGSPDQRTVDIDCFVTHLESQDSTIRDAQISMLGAFIKQHTVASSPILLMGDLNTIGERQQLLYSGSQYWFLRQELGSVREKWCDLGQFIEANDWGTSDPVAPSGGHRIDYIFLADAPGRPLLTPLRASVQRFADPYVGFLSDHCAVEAEFGCRK